MNDDKDPGLRSLRKAIIAAQAAQADADAQAVPAAHHAALRAELVKALDMLRRIAHIAHAGGTQGLREYEAMVHVRRLTAHCMDWSGTTEELAQRVEAAVKGGA